MLLQIASSLWAKPKKIDPNKVYDMMTSPHNAEMHQRSLDMIDPNSQLMRGQYDALKQQGADNLYATNRLTRQNMAATGLGNQSGIQNVLQQDASLDSGAAVNKAYSGMLNSNIGASNSLLGAVTANDMSARNAMTSAYGQNINNHNNWKASHASTVGSLGLNYFMGQGGSSMAQNGDMMAQGMGGSSGGTLAALLPLLLCDENMKENIKKVGTATAKDGQEVGMYEFNYKGRKGKKVGVIAQKIEKTHPQYVHKGKNGKKYVAMGGLF